MDSPTTQPSTINAFDVSKFEHDTNKGKGGLHNSTVSNAQQSLGMSDDKRYSKGKEASITADCGVQLIVIQEQYLYIRIIYKQANWKFCNQVVTQ